MHLRKARYGFLPPAICLGVGAVLVLAGVMLHERTLKYVLQTATPFRLTARIHWWFISLNAVGVGMWLIVARHKIHELALAAVGVSYACIGILLVSIDLGRAYVTLTHSERRTVTGEYQVLDRDLGWALKPYGKAKVVREGVYEAVYEIDSMGFRKTVPSVETSRKIIVLGDSFVFGWGVNDEETLCSRLAEYQHGQAKVVNAGVEGYGITQVYGRFLYDVQEFVDEGDVVIFAFIEDDFERNWPDFVFLSQMLFGSKPLQQIPVFKNGSLEVVTADTFLNRIKALLVYAPWLSSVVTPILQPAPEKALRDAQDMMDSIRRALEARGARFLLVQLPTGAELRSDPPQSKPVRFGALDLRQRFPKDRKTLDGYFLSDDDGHYSPKGHGLVADVLQEELVSRGWPAR